MHIYIKGGTENKPILNEISNALYGRRYGWLGNDRFYFGYTAITANVEQPYCEVTFENEDPEKQMAFIETIAGRFSILRVEAEDQEEEGDTVAAWSHDHQQQPLPKKEVKKKPAGVKTKTEIINPVSPIQGDPKFEIGSTMVSEKDGMTMVYVPAGEFLMGSRDDDFDAGIDERPQHTVYLDGYWIDQTLVTNAMFAKFLNEVGDREEDGRPWIPIGKNYINIIKRNNVWKVETGFENYPIILVKWYGAYAYSKWAEKELLTEAQWEKAARGVDARTYPWGEGIDCNYANYRGCDDFNGTSPVGHYGERGASPYGALDMAGNVWEWVADWYERDYYRTSPKQNPTGPSDGTERVLRGGAWDNDQRFARSAFRNYFYPDLTNDLYGFRCARLP